MRLSCCLAGMRYRVDAATNRELYGAETTPEQILGSESAAPEAFKPLFDVLSKVGGAAAGQKGAQAPPGRLLWQTGACRHSQRGRAAAGHALRACSLKRMQYPSAECRLVCRLVLQYLETGVMEA